MIESSMPLAGTASDRPVREGAVLVSGELSECGWQHRALDHDVLLVAGQRLVASVSCADAGRWQGCTAQVRGSRRVTMMVCGAQTINDAGRGSVRYRSLGGTALLG